MQGSYQLTVLQAARSTRAAAAPKPAATPSSTTRVKAEPTSGAAGPAAAGSAAPSTSAKASKPGSSKRVGGGRDGYAVVQDVLEDDWEDDLEDDADQLSKHSNPAQAFFLLFALFIPFFKHPDKYSKHVSTALPSMLS